MEELLKDLLAKYQTHYNLLEMTCMDLMKKGEPWEEYADQAAALKIMIEGAEDELKKYQSK